MTKNKLVKIVMQRWRTERAYQELKDELGLDHYEGRRFLAGAITSRSSCAATRSSSPVRLRFRTGAPPSQERFVWSIAHEPKGVQLTFLPDLPLPFDQPFTVQL